MHTHIGSVTATHNFPCSGFTFELTESDALDIKPSTLGNLLRLRMLGCRLSIDSFGCGHSSLRCLSELLFNEVKIDASFMRQMNTERRCCAIIGNTVDLAASFDMSVVVEGIETLEQQQQLLELGCTLGQGYCWPDEWRRFFDMAGCSTERNGAYWVDEAPPLAYGAGTTFLLPRYYRINDPVRLQ